MRTINSAIKIVLGAANTQTCLTDDLRSSMKIVANKACYSDNDKDEVNALKDIIIHASVHGAYTDLGRDKMSIAQRELYDSIQAERSLEEY